MNSLNLLSKTTKELRLNYFLSCLIITGLISLFFKLSNFGIDAFNQSKYLDIIGLVGLFLFSLSLAYGGLVHLFARYGFIKRLERHCPTSKKVIDKFFLNYRAPSLVILLPSYKEEIPVILQSLFSSALQDYPNRRVVLLIDNPPDCPKLEETRSLVTFINNSLQIQQHRMEELMSQFQKRLHKGDPNLLDEKKNLIQIYHEIIAWFDNQERIYTRRDHTDDTFINLTFTTRIVNFLQKVQNLQLENLDLQTIEQEYNQLSTLFKVEISYFERKQYHNFSHASNKSMNLNSYISVLGKNYRKIEKNGKKILEECLADIAHYRFVDADFISVLDADSVLTHDYASRLVYEMEQPQFSKTAVIQTPYSAYPNAPGILEQMAGATTDIQYMIHQGFTHFGATFWVGANALIRKKALEDIVEHRMEGNYIVSRYVQDRTVIEDTESSIDLSFKGWELYNFPERLSYSATPPDFGALAIQRKRWANGGLIIFPKTLRYIFQKPFSYQKIKEAFFRFHYLLSIPAAFFSLALMQLSPLSLQSFPLEGSLLIGPYLLVYSRDLSLFGYRSSDIFRIMALNLALLPVNLSGVFQSLKQIIFGKHTFFVRTPKISDLTPVPFIYSFSIFSMLLFEVNCVVQNKGVYDAMMAILLAYGLFSLLNFKQILLRHVQKIRNLQVGRQSHSEL